ncbi:hypothetical protein KL911_004089 [Ogataea haglerorum]|nr:uncharacterized protein KL911_004089 [Ogataea haglerorum]KAG7752291.1 hypothetical protein KL911_004089 [Ogataea haglerorum]
MSLEEAFREVCRVEREEHGETEEVARVEADRLCRGRVAQRVFGQDREGPAVDGDVLRRTEQDEEEKGVGEGVEVFLHVAHEGVDHRSQEQQRESRDRLDRDDPGASSAEPFQVARVDNGRPQQFQRVRVRRQREEADLGVAQLRRFEQKRHRPERQPYGHALDQVQQHQEEEPRPILARQVLLCGAELLSRVLERRQPVGRRCVRVPMDARGGRVGIVVPLQRVGKDGQNVGRLTHERKNIQTVLNKLIPTNA